ncbi:hypothetical protein ABZP36_013743 [Zizania latifolia]
MVRIRPTVPTAIAATRVGAGDELPAASTDVPFMKTFASDEPGASFRMPSISRRSQRKKKTLSSNASECVHAVMCCTAYEGTGRCRRRSGTPARRRQAESEGGVDGETDGGVGAPQDEQAQAPGAWDLAFSAPAQHSSEGLAAPPVTYAMHGVRPCISPAQSLSTTVAFCATVPAPAAARRRTTVVAPAKA